MATHLAPLASAAKRTVALAGLLLVGAGVVGCQADRPATMADAKRPMLAPAPPEPAPRPLPPVTTIRPEPRPQPVQPKPAPQPAGATVAGAREWQPTVAPRKWDWIVIHHSATPVGGAVRFNKEHVAKGWDELGYHFVIGNGTDTGNGVVEVGSRWPKQKQGAHCKTPNNNFNDHGIGICLVGNFDQARPTEAQLKSLTKLVAYLQKTYKIPANRIIGHGDAKATECPGKHVNIAQIRKASAQLLADAGETIPTPQHASAAGKELLVDSAK